MNSQFEGRTIRLKAALQGLTRHNGQRNNMDIGEPNDNLSKRVIDGRIRESVKVNDGLNSALGGPTANKLLDNRVQSWMKVARKHQQGYFHSFQDRQWDEVKSEDILEKKIGFALFGVPKEHDKEKETLSYDSEQNNRINLIKNHILMMHKNRIGVNDEFPILIAFVFVHLHLKGKDSKDGVDVLFRIPKVSAYDLLNCIFVDANCRTYENWNDYLLNNKLPKCYMCYPQNGFYLEVYDSVRISFQESPACKMGESLRDLTSTVLTLGATGVSVASLAIPVAAPFMWGATATLIASGAYDMSRCVTKLIDIKAHHKSISLKNPESRSAWIGLAANAVGMASIGGTAITRSIMKGERAICRTGLITLRLINVSSIAVNGVYVLNDLATLVMKYLDGSICEKDILQFTRICLFYFNVIVSKKQADRLIKDVAASDKVSEYFHAFKYRSYSLIKSTSEINDGVAYRVLENLVGKTSQFTYIISSCKLLKKLDEIRCLVDQYSSGSINLKEFLQDMYEIFGFLWSKYKASSTKSVQDLCTLFKTKDWRSYFITPGYNPFMNSNPDTAWQFNTAIQKTIAYCNLNENNIQYKNDILNLIKEFSIHCPADSSLDFLSKVKYICKYFEAKYDHIKETYYLNFDLQNFNLGNDNINHNSKKNYDFFKEALRDIDMEHAMKNWQDLCSTLSPDQPQHEPLCTGISTCSHFIFSCEELTEQYFWQRASDITGVDLNKDNSEFVYQDNIVFITPFTAASTIMAVIFHISDEKPSVMGIVLNSVDKD